MKAVYSGDDGGVIVSFSYHGGGAAVVGLNSSDGDYTVMAASFGICQEELEFPNLDHKDQVR